MQSGITRRKAVGSLGAAAAGMFLGRPARGNVPAPAAPVAIGKCTSYEPSELLPVLEGMFDKLGGLGKLVKGKTVAIKLNFNGGATVRLGYHPLGDSHWANPNLICAVMSLMTKAGVRRVRLVECAPIPWTTPFEEYFLEANWNVHDFISSAPIVEFENTNYLGSAKKLSRIAVPNGGLLFPAYDVNHSYVDCDVFVSIAKCKDHGTTGVSTVMKNQFGITPLVAYGNFAGKWEDNDLVAGIDRIRIIHQGAGQPAFGAPAELDPKSPRDDGYRVCRAIADLVAARPIHLAITDGVTSMSGGQTPNPSLTFVKPNWIVAGTNVVNTSAVTMAAMNYNPMGQKGEMPFNRCDNKLRLAEQLGVGTCDLSRIEVVGPSIKEVAFDFKTLREKRPAGFNGFGGGRRGGQRGGEPGGPPYGPPDGPPYGPPGGGRN
jgi:uncharacterized protein (DUF362 family)